MEEKDVFFVFDDAKKVKREREFFFPFSFFSKLTTQKKAFHHYPQLFLSLSLSLPRAFTCS